MYYRPAVTLLDQPKAEVARELRVARHQQVELDLLMKANENSPAHILHDEVVLILSAATVGLHQCRIGYNSTEEGRDVTLVR